MNRAATIDELEVSFEKAELADSYVDPTVLKRCWTILNGHQGLIPRRPVRAFRPPGSMRGADVTRKPPRSVEPPDPTTSRLSPDRLRTLVGQGLSRVGVRFDQRRDLRIAKRDDLARQPGRDPLAAHRRIDGGSAVVLLANSVSAIVAIGDLGPVASDLSS